MCVFEACVLGALCGDVYSSTERSCFLLSNSQYTDVLAYCYLCMIH